MGVSEHLKGVDTVLGIITKISSILLALGISGAVVMTSMSESVTGFYLQYGWPGSIIIGLAIFILVWIALNVIWGAGSGSKRVAYLLFALCLVCGVSGVFVLLKDKNPSTAQTLKASSEPTKAAGSSLIATNLKVAAGDSINLFQIYGVFARSGTSAKVYVDFDRPDRNEIKRGNDSIVTYPRRVRLKEFKDFTKGEPIKVVLASFEPPNVQIVVRWGAAEYGPSVEEDRFALRDPMDGRIVITDDKGNEQYCNFWLRPKVGNLQMFSNPQQKLDASNLMLFTQEMMQAQSSWN
jgi:hypothetical protein